MIVDDEAFNQFGLMTVMKTLRRFKGIARLIDLANDGTEAVKKARDGLTADIDKGYVYCLVFMDLSMPIMDGYEATEALRAIYSQH